MFSRLPNRAYRERKSKGPTTHFEFTRVFAAARRAAEAAASFKFRRICREQVGRSASQRFQVLDEIGFLIWRQIETEQPVVMIHHGEKVGRTPVVEVRRVL
jgi:hypothetical protein